MAATNGALSSPVHALALEIARLRSVGTTDDVGRDAPPFMDSP
jgi:hypothetical protein